MRLLFETGGETRPYDVDYLKRCLWIYVIVIDYDKNGMWEKESTTNLPAEASRTTLHGALRRHSKVEHRQKRSDDNGGTDFSQPKNARPLQQKRRELTNTSLDNKLLTRISFRKFLMDGER